MRSSNLIYIKDKEKYPPIIANGPWVTERIIGPHESLAEQIQRRTGLNAQDVKTIVLRLVILSLYFITH